MHASDNHPTLPQGWFRPYHSPHRRRVHEKTLAEEKRFVPEEVPHHPLIPPGTARIVKQPEELQELIDRLRSEPRFGYDSEFIGEHSYFPKLCLVQISTPESIDFIDALADLDLTPFWQLITDASVEKIVHCGIQDLEPAYRHTGRPPANIFDTQIGGAFIGAGYPRGLASMIDEFLNIKLGHEMKFTQWDTRPLSPRQLAYAADDVRYLHRLRQAVADKLEDAGHARWAAEQNTRLCEVDTYRFEALNEKMMSRSFGDLGRIERQVLEDLIKWRDLTARGEDVPPRSLLRDNVLLEMSRRDIRTAGDLRSIPGLPRPVIQYCEKQLLHVIDTARHRAGRIVNRPGPIPPSRRQAFNTMWGQVRSRCEERGIDPALVANKQHVVTYFKNILHKKPNASSPMQTGWRRELLGPLLDHWYDLLHHA